MAWEKRNMFGLVGGLNDVIDATMLKDIESPNMEDMYFKGVNIRTRPGKAKYNTTVLTGSKTITGIYVYEQWDGTVYSVVGAGTDLWKDVSTVWTALGGTYTEGADYYWDFATHDNYMIATNGIEPLQKWDGSTLDACAAANNPTAFYIEEFWNRLVACGNASNPYRVWWSNLGDPTTFTATDYLDIPQAGKINGMKKLGRVLYLFAKTQIYAMYYTGNPDIPFRVEAVNTEVGCVAPHSIVEVNGWLYFMSAQGFMKFNGLEIVNLSEKKIHNLFLNSIDATRKKYTIGAHNEKKGQIWWLYTASGGSVHSKIIAYDYKYDAWLPFNKDANYIYFNPIVPGLETLAWMQTTKADFDAGTPVNIDTAVASGTFRIDPTETKKVEFATNDGSRDLINWAYAQSFQVDENYIITKIAVYVKKAGSPANLGVDLKHDSGSDTPGSSYAESILDKDTIGGSLAWEDETVLALPDRYLTKDTTYWVQLSYTADPSNYYSWGENAAGGYADGHGWAGPGGGGTLANDFNFRIYGYPASGNLISQQYNFGTGLVAWQPMIFDYEIKDGTFVIKTQTAPDVTGSPGTWEAEASLDDSDRPTSTIETNTWFRWRVYLTITDNEGYSYLTPIVSSIETNVSREPAGSIPSLTSGDYAGFVFKEDYGTNENTAGINAFWESKWHFFENPELKKIMRYLQVFLVAQGNWTVTIRYRWDYADAWTDLSKNLSGGSEEVLKPRFATKGVGHYLQFRFQHYVADQPFELVGFTVFLKKLRGAVRTE